MTRQQRASIILSYFNTPSNIRSEFLDLEMQHFGLSENGREAEKENIKNSFNNGIKNLNSNQLNNILKIINENKFNKEQLKSRLIFYEIDPEWHENIIQFFEDYFQSNQLVDVGDLDLDFKGVQVASRDNFNKILSQGWTGDWILTPDNIEPKRIQIASMNEDGNFPRGYYMNADIIKIEPITYGNQIRHRVFISNPTIINTGNRNVKFNLNPVKYIR